MEQQPEDPRRAAQPDAGPPRVLHVAHHEHREQQHQHHQALVLEVQVGERGPVPGRLAEGVVHRQRHSRGGAGQAGEPIAGGLAVGQHVVAGQAERRRHHVDKADDPGELPRVGELQEVHHHRGRQPEGDHVHQRVQLGAEPTPGIRQPGQPPVQHVQHPGQNHEESRPLEVPGKGRDDGPEPEEQAGQGERAGNHHHHAPDSGPPASRGREVPQVH